MGKGWKIFWLITAAVVIPGGLYAGIGVAMLMRICYQMAGFKITAFDRSNIYMDVNIQISNPSILSVTVSGYDLNIYLNDAIVANVKNDIPSEIESKADSKITLPIAVNFRKSFGAVKAPEMVAYFVAKQYDKITLKMDGVFKAKLMGIPVTYKVKQESWTWTLEEILKIMSEPSVPCK